MTATPRLVPLPPKPHRRTVSARVKEWLMCAALVGFVLAALAVDAWFAALPWPPAPVAWGGVTW